MSVLQNSNNIIFANGGGTGECPISASFVLGGIDNSKVSAMTFQVIRPDQSTTGNTVIVRNEAGASGEFALIPYSDDATGMLYYNSGDIDFKTPYSVSSQTTSTSGCKFYGSTAYDASYVFLNSNDNEGEPMELTLPARSESDIFYDAMMETYDCAADVNLRLGVKATNSTANNDYISYSPIVFPKTDNDSRSRDNFSTVLRVKNESYSPVTVYPAVKTNGYGTFPDGSQFEILEDSIKTRSYPL